MSDDLKKLLIVMVVKSREQSGSDNGSIMLAASINIHNDGLSVFAAPDPATRFLFGDEFCREQMDLLSPVLDQIAENFEKAIVNKNWKEF